MSSELAAAMPQYLRPGKVRQSGLLRHVREPVIGAVGAGADVEEGLAAIVGCDAAERGP